jgi:hypothetical protein
MACVTFFDFFDKEYILILRKYQLHSANATMQYPSSNMDAHSHKKENELQKKKSSATVINYL